MSRDYEDAYEFTRRETDNILGDLHQIREDLRNNDKLLTPEAKERATELLSGIAHRMIQIRDEDIDEIKDFLKERIKQQ